VPSTFLGLTGGRGGGYGLIEVCMDAGDEIDKVARWENKNRVCTGVGWVYQGVINCTIEHQEA
jgi:hypothetical protein